MERRIGNDRFAVRPLKAEETGAALRLTWRVFSEFEAPDYPPEGVEEFRRCLNDARYLAGLSYYGAFDGEALIGVLAARGAKGHICFFFVDGAYHRRGVGTGLFERLREDFPGALTVNSSPFGLPVYERLGFTALSGEQTVNGIRFTPMALWKASHRKSSYIRRNTT